MKALSSETAQALLAHVLALLLIEAVAVAIGYLGAITLPPDNYKAQWAVGLLLFSVISLSGLFAVYRFDRYRPWFPRLMPEFKIMSRSICYHYHSETKMTYKRRYRLQALRRGADHYVDKYRWTGEGSTTPTSRINGQILRNKRRKNVWQFFDVVFPRPLGRREEIEVELVWELEDPARKAVPFFSVTVEEPTDLLSLELQLPSEFGVTSVVCEHAPYMGAKEVFKSMDKELDRDGKVVWTISRPKLLHYYEIRWGNSDG